LRPGNTPATSAAQVRIWKSVIGAERLQAEGILGQTLIFFIADHGKPYRY
jgi:hypothetical protein